MDKKNAVAKILSYWFGNLKDGWSTDNCNRLWFGGKPEDDKQMRENFGPLIDAAETGRLSVWQKEADSCVALILLADQMTRATRRSSREAFAGDPVALAASHSCIASNLHLAMPPVHRIFAYMPLMHSENIRDQDLCVKMFENLVRDFAKQHKSIAGSLEYAILHRDIIRRFERFPHRNEILERPSTEAEKEYLSGNPQSFGQ